MRNPPYWLERRGIVWKAWYEMPMNVRGLIAKQAIVHFFSCEGPVQHFCQPADFLHELDAFGRRQIKQFRGMAFEHNDAPAGEKLVVMKIGRRQSQIRNEVV